MRPARGRPKFAGWASGLFALLSLGLSARQVWAAEADSALAVQATIDAVSPNIRLTSIGTVCVHVVAGAVTNPGNEPTCATSSLPPPALAGRGRSKPKFFLLGGTLQPNVDGYSNQATTGAGGAMTRSEGTADWFSVLVPDTPRSAFGAWHAVSAKVSNDAGAVNRGRAVGEARDPLEFSMAGANTLSYIVALSELRIKSDSPLGRNRLRLVATFENVTRNGVPVAGPLWTLTVTSQGVVTAQTTLAVDLTFWSGLGISTAQEAAAEQYLREQIKPLDEGYLGFSDEVELIGNDGPIPAIVLNHPANQVVRYLDAVSADTELVQGAAPVPALPTAAVAGLGLLLAIVGIRRLQGPLKRL